MDSLQKRRRWFQTGFFLLFLLAPLLDIFRFDLTQGHFILLGAPWTLDIDAFVRAEISPLEASLNLLANSRAMVVAFETPRAKVCQECNNACDNVCPMRLKPRTVKRRMFTCTECAQCISACEQVQQDNPLGGVLHWVEGDCALPVVSGRKQQPRCFDQGIPEVTPPLDKRT